MTKLQTKMRVLLVNRPDNFKIRGGDTMHINRLKTGLEKLGVHVDISTSLDVNPTGYDLINIFNLLIPTNSVFQLSALRMQTRAPIIMTPFYWDMSENIWADAVIPLAVENAVNDPDLEKYLQQIDQGILNAGYLTRKGKNLPNLEFEEQQKLGLEFVDHLIPISNAEDRILRKNLPCEDIPSTMVPTGMDLEIEEADPNLFIEEYGVKDFVLATGRVEGRKNQLMLLLAMRNTNIPVVIVGSHPDKHYLKLCKKIAPKGTIFTGRISYELLKSARAAAKVHCLPSWWECAGIVHLEAGLAGCAVVAGKQAAEPEYLEDFAYYCDPGSVTSIKNAVLKAYNNYDKDALKRAKFKDFLKNKFSWDLVAERTLEIYKKALIENISSQQSNFETRRFKREFAQAVYHAFRDNPAGALIQLEKQKTNITKKPIYQRIAAKQYFAIGQNQIGMELLSKTVQDEPENPLYQLDLAKSYARLGENQKALEILINIPIDQSNSRIVNSLLAEIYLDKKEIDQAIEVLGELVDSHPKNTKAKAMLAGCFSQQGNSIKAGDLFEQSSLISEKAYYFKREKEKPTPNEILQKLTKAADFNKALDENYDFLDKGLISLIMKSASSASLKGNKALSTLFTEMASTIGERIGVAINQSGLPPAHQRFEILMTSEDVMAALDENFQWIDEDLHKVVQEQAALARKENKPDYAVAMDNLSEYLEQAILLKSDHGNIPLGDTEDTKKHFEDLLDQILSAADPTQTIQKLGDQLDDQFLNFLQSQIDLLNNNEEFEAAEALTAIYGLIEKGISWISQPEEKSAEEVLNLLLSYDDLSKALKENPDLLSNELYLLVCKISEESESKGEFELATGYKHLAEYIKERLSLQ